MEDRSGCPALLRLDLADIPDSIGQVIVAIADRNGNVRKDTVDKSAYMQIYETGIPRGNTSVAVLGNTGEMYFDNSGIMIPTGRDAEDIHTWFVSENIAGESYSGRVSICRDNTVLHIRIAHAGYNLEGNPVISLSSSSRGYRFNGIPASGVFLYVAETVPAHFHGSPFYCLSVRLLRLKENDLTMKISCGGDDTEIDLSGLLLKAGIDLRLTQKEDIYVTIDTARAVLGISVGEWTDNGHVEIEL